MPSGRGSCTGSQVMLELILNKKAPRAIILRDVDSILCTGAVIAEEFFGEDIEHGDVPIICAVGEEQFAKLIDDGKAWLDIVIDRIQYNPIYAIDTQEKFIHNIENKYFRLLERFEDTMSKKLNE